jgi:hypothetical protein
VAGAAIAVTTPIGTPFRSSSGLLDMQFHESSVVAGGQRNGGGVAAESCFAAPIV